MSYILTVMFVRLSCLPHIIPMLDTLYENAVLFSFNPLSHAFKSFQYRMIVLLQTGLVFAQSCFSFAIFHKILLWCSMQSDKL